MLTISRLTRWSIGYYNDNANTAKRSALNARAANGVLGEYYSEADTRVPTWLLTGDRAAVAGLCGLDAAAVAGGVVDTEVAAAWLNDGVAPNGQRGRAFGEKSAHGFDLTFAAPKSVSLVRVLTDPVAEKVFAAAHEHAIAEAITYLHRHAGYTRVHNPITGLKDLQRLPGIAAIAYQHETSRCGDPHLHTHVIVPNRQARGDGELVSLDSKSLYHEAKAAGMIYQATLRHQLHAERGFEWQPVEEHSGMAEIAGVTRLREWARQNLVVVDGEPTAAQLAAAQKATRPAKPESLAFEELKAMWRADARGLHLDRGAHHEARARRTSEARASFDRARLAAAAARIEKAAFTRADLVEVIAAQLPVDAASSPRDSVEAAVEEMGMRLSAPRSAHHREGHKRFTLDRILAEEAAVLDLADTRDDRAQLWIKDEDTAGLSGEQARAVRAIAHSPWLVQPLSAPAGAGKTTALRALASATRRSQREVLVVAPTGKAVDVALRDGAGEHGQTVAKAVQSLRDGTLRLDRRMVVVVDEAAMVGTDDLRQLLSATTAAGAKTVLVGDAHQLAPVKARGGMFAHLCADLPWAQHLSQVWRMRDPAERAASLGVRDGDPAAQRQAVDWYRHHDRLRCGDAVTMASDALTAYRDDIESGKDTLLVCDTTEMADALNHRLHDDHVAGDAPTVAGARDHRIGVGDLILTRRNDATIALDTAHPEAGHPDGVRNGQRWRVAGLDTATNRVAAERLGDGARAVFDGDYVREHLTLGYAVTVPSAQGVTTDTTHALLGETATRSLFYVAMTRGREANIAYLYERAAESDTSSAAGVPGVQRPVRGAAGTS